MVPDYSKHPKHAEPVISAPDSPSLLYQFSESPVSSFSPGRKRKVPMGISVDSRSIRGQKWRWGSGVCILDLSLSLSSPGLPYLTPNTGPLNLLN